MSKPETVSIRLRAAPTVVVATGQGVWAGVGGGARRSRVVRIDPATNAIAAAVPVEGRPFHMAAGEDAVWVTGNFDRGGDVLHRIDPRTNRLVATISLPGGRAGPVAAGHGGVWVVVGGEDQAAAALARIDPRTNELAGTNRFEGGPPCNAFVELAVADGAVWALALQGLDGPGDLIRVDPNSGQVTARIEAGALNMGGGPGGLWITGCVDCDGYRDSFFVQEIDTDEDALAGRRTVLPNTGASPLFAGTRPLWLSGHRRGSGAVVLELDPRTRAVKRILRLGTFLYSGMAFDTRNRAIWIARVAPASLVRVRLGDA